MLERIYFLQQWFNLSDRGVGRRYTISRPMRAFAKIDLGCAPPPDETTVCKCRHLLERDEFGPMNLVFQRHAASRAFRIWSHTSCIRRASFSRRRGHTCLGVHRFDGERANLREVLRRNPVFSFLHEARFDAVVTLCAITRFVRSNPLFSSGSIWTRSFTSNVNNVVHGTMYDDDVWKVGGKQT
jgi:hypothetical protein